VCCCSCVIIPVNYFLRSRSRMQSCHLRALLGFCPCICSRWLWRLPLEPRLSVPLAGRTDGSGARHVTAGALSRSRVPAAPTQRCPEASPAAASRMLSQNISLPSGFLDIWVLGVQGRVGQSRGCRSGGCGWVPNPSASSLRRGALPPGTGTRSRPMRCPGADPHALPAPG